jgi:hypothetical protein
MAGRGIRPESIFCPRLPITKAYRRTKETLKYFCDWLLFRDRELADLVQPNKAVNGVKPEVD